MGLFLTGLIIGLVLGVYVGNKTFRERVNKDAKKLYTQLAGENKTRRANGNKDAKSDAK